MVNRNRDGQEPQLTFGYRDSRQQPNTQQPQSVQSGGTLPPMPPRVPQQPSSQQQWQQNDMQQQRYQQGGQQNPPRHPQVDAVYGYESDQPPPMPPGEQFSFDGMDGEEPPRRRLGILFLLMLVIIAGGLTAWMLLGEAADPNAPAGQIPTIQADQTPLRTRPDDPGGMQVPNRDRLVYERLGGAGTPPPKAAGSENILPPPENPQAPVVTTPPPTPAPPPGVVQVQTDPPVQYPPVQQAPQPPMPPMQQQPSQVPLTQPQVQQPSAPPSPPAPTPTIPPPVPDAAPVAAPTSGSFVVQLAAVTSQDAATKEWNRLKKAHPEILGSLTLDVQKATLPKGIFYRVRGGMIDERSARSLCAELTKKKVGCIVAKK